MASELNHSNRLVDHLYRHEAGKLVAVLTRVFGTDSIKLAEDVTHDSLIEAIKDWPYKGLPTDPSSWLYKVAKNKTLNILNKEKYKKKYSSELSLNSYYTWASEPSKDHSFSANLIRDDQLRMIFTICHPALSKDSQVALMLKTVCAFSIPEIAHALCTNEETINKRLVRARQKISDGKIPFEFPSVNEIKARLDAVLETIYFVFNVGYNATPGNEIIFYELCEEAIRLTEMLVTYPGIENKSSAYALLALMLLNVARFSSRIGKEGNILTLAEQNRKEWNPELMQKGFAYLERSTADNSVSIYHILATISAYHCAAPDFESTDWQGILRLYDHLVVMDHSPLVKLNRTIPLSKIFGPRKAIEELEQLKNDDTLSSHHLLYSTEGEFYCELHEYEKAAAAFKKAIGYSSLEAEKDLIARKLKNCMEKLG